MEPLAWDAPLPSRPRRILVAGTSGAGKTTLAAALACQQVPRTVRRRLRRVELWNGNVEPPLRTVLTNRDHIVRWAWRTHAKAAVRVRRVLASEDPPVVVRLGTRGEVRAWLDGPVAAVTAR